MIHIFYYPQEKVAITLFRGSITQKDIDHYTNVFSRFHISMTATNKLTVVTDMKDAKVIDASIKDRLAAETEKHYKSTHHIYVVNMSAFISVLFKLYLKLGKFDSLHTVYKGTLHELCCELGIQSIDETNYLQDPHYHSSSIHPEMI